MTKSKLHNASTNSMHLPSPADTPAGHPEWSEGAQDAHFSRRSFLYSLGAMALTACGGGGAAVEPLSGSQSQSQRLLAATTASTSGAFAHPGLLHTQADFDRMALKMNSAPWSASWALLINNSHAKLTYNPAPVAIVYRGYDGVHTENYSRLFNDIAAAYACALRWKLTGDNAYADKSVQIMNAWSSTLTAISGTTDQNLAAGIYGYEFANAAEIMRNYAGWAAADIARFTGMMRNIFLPMNQDFLVRHNNTDVTHYWSNWDLCNMASIMAIGVLCDDQALFDYAVTYFKSGAGNGAIAQMVYYVHPGYLGQAQESGRDQGHNTLSISLMGAICEMAWNQGVDLYGYDNNRFLMAAEYVAKGNLKETATSYYTVPFAPYSNIDKVKQTVFSTTGQGEVRPCWALVYHHYVNRMGLAAPYSGKFMQLISPEGGGGNYGPNSGGYDQLGYGTLTCTRDPIASGAAPSGLSGYASAGTIILSWWGGAYATSYTVKRAVTAGGPYTTVASGITDLLTWSDAGLTDGTYYYVVSATTPAGESAASNEAKVSIGVQLLTWLKFDDAAGASAIDSSGNGNDGTLAGTTSWVTGKRDGAVAFGTGGHVSLPPDILRDVDDFTISTWVYWNAARTWDRVFDFGSSTSRYMMLTARGATGVLRFGITVSGYDAELLIDSNAALPRSSWSHVVVTLKGNVGTMYVNGVAVGTNNNMFLAPFRLQGTKNNWIGRSQNPVHPYFNGKIDDFRIYRGALSAENVVALMNDQMQYVDMAASVQVTQQGATYNRINQKYVGSVTLTSKGGPAVSGPFRLLLTGLTSGVTLDNASGVDAGVPYVIVNARLAPGATLNVPLTFTNPSRSVVAYMAKLNKNAF